MFKRYADKMTSVLIYNNMIDNHESRVYSYGFEILIAFIVNITTILLLGFLFGKFTYILFFLICYCPIRQFSGGYHANNYFRCLLTFIFIILSTIFIIENLNVYLFKNIIMIIASISWIGICIMCPVEHKSNPISEIEKLTYKKIAISMSTVVLLMTVSSFSSNVFMDYFIYSAFAMFWICIMLVLGKLKSKKNISKMCTREN
ncbi:MULTISPECIES: accessory gene regulator ArgB-like protein [unclassified Clostridioides]|uniref:accessory gene regulator ArgB-like protein n=1 Tax=unclassified Clostridioides TaxID=2635829 RepID=UPI001D0C6B85|nr:accessory gene regulator B family protein [Clostridioides sp. ES-S-0001-02]MCC0639440.1 accessory gene regulator B family protein [Clostridioides sp. ES-S-0049-03]MCC0651517.1 accessory gene regulator B family protein [Clostridioides sp. ES-S-0001-03]MCC0655684.1 accessory gene regulator B family protein [Clostridioides sp. ES-S-0123-01]MCC0674040.1 accessory gene regulator B family protein [Clostridioides sp. ES-S-0145-01]MCC0676634.1 accessory gene regulator B family protein [Clostridioid